MQALKNNLFEKGYHDKCLGKTFQTIFICFVLGFLITVNSQRLVTAAWSSNTHENTAICTASGQQSSLQIVSDGVGGAIIAWEDTRNVHFDIYAQRVDAHGNVLWKKDGVSICSAPENQNRPRIVSDGAGGAIITWHDVRNGISNSDIYAQHIDADGNVQWTKDGIPVCAVANAQNSPCIATDGAGGAIVVWQDFRRTYADIYAQRVDGSGKTAWERSGVALCNAPGHESFPVITGNGAEGAIVAWVDTRNGNNDVFAQQVDGNGAVQWLTNGIPVCTVSGNQNYPVMVSDGAGGAILAWWDMRSGDFNIYAQRIDLTGNALWVKDGLAVCVEANIQNCAYISSDGSG